MKISSFSVRNMQTRLEHLGWLLSGLSPLGESLGVRLRKTEDEYLTGCP